MFEPIYQLLGTALNIFIGYFDSFVLGMLGFTAVVKLVLVPVGVMQQRGTIRQMKVRPREEIIRREHAGDNNRINMEITELYRENNVSVAGGCLPMLIQLPLLLGLYRIIQMPLTYVLKLPNETIMAAAEFLDIVVKKTGKVAQEAGLAQVMYDNAAALVQQGIIEPGQRMLNFSLAGLDLSATPKFGLNLLIIIPLLSALTTYLTSWMQSKTMPPTPQTQAMNRQMTFTMPLLMLWIGFTVPGALSLYWLFSNVLGLAQSAVLNAIWSPKKALADAYAEEEERARQIRERRETKKKKKVNLGGLKPGELPPEFEDDDDEPELTPEEQERLRAQQARRRKNYRKVLKMQPSIPSPYEDDEEEAPPPAENPRRKKRREEQEEAGGDSSPAEGE